MQARPLFPPPQRTDVPVVEREAREAAGEDAGQHAAETVVRVPENGGLGRWVVGMARGSR